MKQKLFFLSITLALYSVLNLSVHKAHAQEGNIWAFGDKAGVDFNTNPPTAIETSIQTNEGSAAISDSTGQLLFYTDGTSAWDRNHNLMLNGSNLTAAGNITSSTSQGALIAPMPGAPHKYYVFSLGNKEDPIYVGRLYYSVVDLTQNSGLGEVVLKARPMDSLLTEHMMGVSGNDCNIWLLVISRSADVIKAYNINEYGISPAAVTSPRVPGGGSAGGIIGNIDISPDRSKVAVTQGNIVLYDFDVNSGILSNPLVLDSNVSDSYYGVCFSPDNTKLYASSAAPLWQFDLSLPSPADIRASKTLLTYLLDPAIKRGPDGKIYCGAGGNYLNVINRPNLAGTACQFVYQGFPLLPGTHSLLGLPNNVNIVRQRKVYSSRSDTFFCTDQHLLTAEDTLGINYIWDDGSTGISRSVDGSGRYWVRYDVHSPCMLEEHVDTFEIVFDNSRDEIVTVTEYNGWCTLDTLLLKASNTSGSDYIWNDDQVGMQRSVNASGVYWVRYKNDALCEDYVDSFKVTYPGKSYAVSFMADTVVCENDIVLFENTSDSPFTHFSWTFGYSDSSLLESPQHTFAQAGSYSVRLIGQIDSLCADTAYKTVIVDAPLASFFTFDPDGVCVGQPVVFSQALESATIDRLQWEFGDGIARFSKTIRVQHAYDRAGSMPVSLNAQLRACPDDTYTDTVRVYPLPEVDLGGDTSLCPQGQPLYLENLQAAPFTPYRRLWSTGDTTERIKVLHPGTYTLSLSLESTGCTSSESITIRQDCYIDIPNVFTPNGDGHNDHFFPRKRLSEGLTRFHMQVFNRSGQIVFETNRPDGRGWDGRFNNKAQPMGVYVYRIDAHFHNGRQEKYEGNVTLLR